MHPNASTLSISEEKEKKSLINQYIDSITVHSNNKINKTYRIIQDQDISHDINNLK